MSIVDENYCACGKKWTELSPDCVFNYHPKQETNIEKSKHNRACPKCGSHVVGCIFEDVKPDLWTEFGACCSQCDWEIQLRSSNA